MSIYDIDLSEKPPRVSRLRRDDVLAAAALFEGLAPVAERYELPHELGAEQRALVAATLRRIAAQQRVSLFPGAAGTGKTTTIRALLAVLERCGAEVTIAAPTHKAASRAREALGTDPHGNPRQVVTVHRVTYQGAVEQTDCPACDVALDAAMRCPVCEGVYEYDDDLAFRRRQRGGADAGDVLVVDEASMIGADTADALLDALEAGTCVVAVGDPHQLPPVDGPPGFDLAAAPLTLTQVYRQAEGSAILRAATALRAERVPFTWSPCGADWRRGEAILREAGVPTPWRSADEAAATLARMLERCDGDAVGIVGVHVSRVALNDATRALLGHPDRALGPAPGERLVARATRGPLRNADVVTVARATPQDFGPRFGPGWVVEVRAEGGGVRELGVLAGSWTCAEAKHRGLVPRSIRDRLDAWRDEDLREGGRALADAVEAAYEGGARGAEADVAADAARALGLWGVYLRRRLADVDTGYALTCHAAQGSQYREVLVVSDVVDFIADNVPDQVYRWSYTALTRAVEMAIVVRRSRGGWGRA